MSFPALYNPHAHHLFFILFLFFRIFPLPVVLKFHVLYPKLGLFSINYAGPSGVLFKSGNSYLSMGENLSLRLFI